MSPPTVWIYARLSRSTEASTSVERQLIDAREMAARRWPRAQTIEITDDGVSGSVPPERRDGFGRIVAAWQPDDVVIFWKLDRLARSLIGFADIMRLSRAAGVALVSVKDPFDLSTPDGRMQANILATFAEYEREMVRVRVNSMRAHLLRQGRWTGGRAPYGLMSSPHPSGSGKVLRRDPEAAPVVKEIVSRVLAQEPITTIAADLQARGIPSPRMQTAVKANAKPSAWSSRGIRLILESPSIVGHALDPATHRLVRDAGVPVQLWEPIVSEEDQAQALASLPAATGRKSPRGRHWLYGVATCGDCTGNMKTTNGGSQQPELRVFRCLGPLRAPHPLVSVQAPALSAFVNSEVTSLIGSLPVQSREWAGGADPTADIARLRAYLAELDDDRKAGLFSDSDGTSRFRRLYKATVYDIAELEAVPAVESGWRVVEGTERYGDLWAAYGDDERGDLLRDLGARVIVRRPEVPRSRVPLAQRAQVHFGDLESAAEEARTIREEA